MAYILSFIAGMKTFGFIKLRRQDDMLTSRVYPSRHDLIRNTYGILGTPTYLILHKGNVPGTILGKISIQSLIDHLTASSLIHADHKEDVPPEGKAGGWRDEDENRKKKSWDPG